MDVQGSIPGTSTGGERRMVKDCLGPNVDPQRARVLETANYMVIQAEQYHAAVQKPSGMLAHFNNGEMNMQRFDQQQILPNVPQYLMQSEEPNKIVKKSVRNNINWPGG